MSQEDDKLDALWRRASAEDAGRPAAKTRAAILAEAAAAARRREPAANAPRYWMRMAAGVAVVGIGVVLWRQTEVRLPGEAPVAAPASTVSDAMTPVPAPEPAVPDAPAMRGAPPAPPAPPPAPPAPPPAVQSFDNAARAQESQAPQVALRQQPEAAAQQEMKVMQERAPAPSGADLLREHFPAQYASAQAHRLWVVLDEAGKVLLTGELAPEQRLEDLAPQIRRETGRDSSSWRIELLANQQDRRIEMAILRLPR